MRLNELRGLADSVGLVSLASLGLVTGLPVVGLPAVGLGSLRLVLPTVATPLAGSQG